MAICSLFPEEVGFGRTDTITLGLAARSKGAQSRATNPAYGARSRGKLSPWKALEEKGGMILLDIRNRIAPSI